MKGRGNARSHSAVVARRYQPPVPGRGTDLPSPDNANGNRHRHRLQAWGPDDELGALRRVVLKDVVEITTVRTAEGG